MTCLAHMVSFPRKYGVNSAENSPLDHPMNSMPSTIG